MKLIVSLAILLSFKPALAMNLGDLWRVCAGFITAASSGGEDLAEFRKEALYGTYLPFKTKSHVRSVIIDERGITFTYPASYSLVREESREIFGPEFTEVNEEGRSEGYGGRRPWEADTLDRHLKFITAFRHNTPHPESFIFYRDRKGRLILDHIPTYLDHPLGRFRKP